MAGEGVLLQGWADFGARRFWVGSKDQSVFGLEGCQAVGDPPCDRTRTLASVRRVAGRRQQFDLGGRCETTLAVSERLKSTAAR
jgi:hypothetical protein